ncbi:sensor histidine kinase [Demequina salsinemoris]|uniref:sensor histidine kinase n=1 Tax=Demequina salsinemoris TaxID=577470 RepID=UPI000782B77E|nr:HAMP domain-containing sensor histidine kinase [Demequina salsinemoris]
MSTRTLSLRTVNVRTRIVASMMFLAAAALLVSGLIAERIQDSEIKARIDEDITSDAEEFVQFVEDGVDPTTGEAFASPREALRASLERTIPEPHEGIVGFVDGELAYVVDDAPLTLESDAELLAAIAPLTLATDQSIVRIETDVTTYRVAVTPAHATADGSLVVGADSGVVADGEVAAEVRAYDEVAELARFNRAFSIYAWVALGCFVLVSVAAWSIAGRLLRPVRVLAGTAREIGRDDLSERIPVTGNDDLADMTEAVNEMLGRIEAAFASHTALLDDVSHELRTPITVVRGHLELMDPDDSADAAEAREVGLDELDRMSRLVEDLMTLAKSDRPGFVRPAPVDLEHLTESVLTRARALGDREWVLDECASGTIVVDEQRLAQALLQLASNAVRFSPDGSDIGIGSSVDGDTVRLWVRDRGRGIEPELLPHLFERYSQGRRNEGIGLGLAIVSAIAQAHGGTVDVESTPGEGSTLTLVLPVGEPTDEGQQS